MNRDGLVISLTSGTAKWLVSNLDQGTVQRNRFFGKPSRDSQRKCISTLYQAEDQPIPNRENDYGEAVEMSAENEVSFVIHRGER